MPDKAKIYKSEGKWSVRAGGAVLAESTNALEVILGDDSRAIYFPREDVAMAFLDAADTPVDTAFGPATNFAIQTKSETLENAAWTYDAPPAGFERLLNHLSFRASDKVAVEKI